MSCEKNANEIVFNNNVEKYLKGLCATLFYKRVPEIEKVIFSDPATVVLWNDGTKTVVKTHDDEFSKEQGLAMAIARRYFGSRGKFLQAVEKAEVKEKKPKKAKKKGKKGKKAAKERIK